MAQKEGCYPRVNGTMLLSNQYNGMIVSLVGKVVSHGNLQASDGTNVSLSMDFLEGYHVNPDMAVEIIGHVESETNVQAFVARELSTDMDLEVYNQMLAVQHSMAFSQYFPPATVSATN